MIVPIIDITMKVAAHVVTDELDSARRRVLAAALLCVGSVVTIHGIGTGERMSSRGFEVVHARWRGRARALAACCGFDLCHKYILYLYLYFFFARSVYVCARVRRVCLLLRLLNDSLDPRSKATQYVRVVACACGRMCARAFAARLSRS